MSCGSLPPAVVAKGPIGFGLAVQGELALQGVSAVVIGFHQLQGQAVGEGARGALAALASPIAKPTQRQPHLTGRGERRGDQVGGSSDAHAAYLQGGLQGLKGAVQGRARVLWGSQVQLTLEVLQGLAHPALRLAALPVAREVLHPAQQQGIQRGVHPTASFWFRTSSALDGVLSGPPNRRLRVPSDILPPAGPSRVPREPAPLRGGVGFLGRFGVDLEAHAFALRRPLQGGRFGGGRRRVAVRTSPYELLQGGHGVFSFLLRVKP
eukprot:scaffold3008_cov1771-Pavlova_lutheri.AAC.1